MARKPRVQYPGAIYHVMNRGDHREPIFKDDADRRRFLETLGEACFKAGWQVHAYCLMPNHFHLVVETPRANLVEGMKWFLGTYTNRFNRRHKLVGHLFSGRYKALLVDGESAGYLQTVCDYVHLNPARSNLVRQDQALGEYPWSSFPAYLKPPGRRPAWLRVDRLLGEYRVRQDNTAGRRQLAAAVEARRERVEPGKWTGVRRGWFLGAAEAKERLLEQMARGAPTAHRGEVRRETDLRKAERLVAEELKSRGWTEGDLARRRKSDPAKVVMAVRLRQETVMTLEWIARRLQMGCRDTLANCLKASPNRQ
jgi:putative transposase